MTSSWRGTHELRLQVRNELILTHGTFSWGVLLRGVRPRRGTGCVLPGISACRQCAQSIKSVAYFQRAAEVHAQKRGYLISRPAHLWPIPPAKCYLCGTRGRSHDELRDEIVQILDGIGGAL